ncbi:MAG: hypothetical protein RLW62_11755, partial [Gammaproteobacteria bacterium]
MNGRAAQAAPGDHAADDAQSALAPPSPGAPGAVARWTRLYGAAKALAIASAARAAARPWVVLTANAAAAAHLEQELAFFAPELPRHVLPDWETLPYDRFSPYQDIVSERIATLSRLPALAHGIVIAAV